MKFELADGTRFSLEVDRYEFPDEELGPTEDNPADGFCLGRFLFVTISAATAGGAWTATAPEMTTEELEDVADWLETVSKGKAAAVGVYFTERDLEIGVDEQQRLLVVYLWWDFLPPWMKRNEGPLKIAFPLEQFDLAMAIASIRAMLAKFPGRPIPEGVDPKSIYRRNRGF